MAKKKYNPNKKKIKEIISRANNSGANFVSRLKQKDRSYIPDWEVDGNIATHKMRAEIDGDGRAIVFPDVQEIEGVLHDFTDPKYGHKQWDSMDSAIHNNDTIIFDSLDEAIWFSENYKNYYPKFDKYKEGGNKSDWKPSENILKYLKSWEKFEPELYDDKKGNITIGYGFHLPHILKKYKNGITVEEADKEFEDVVNTFVPEFIRRTPNFKNLNNNQRDALFSLFYNTGGPEYSKSPMLFKYLKEGDYDKAVKEINHNENEKGMGGQKKRRAFERRVFSTPTDRPWTVDDDSNYVLIEDKPVENESIEKDTNDSKYEDARHVEAKYGYTGYIGGGYDGNKVRVSDSNMKSVGISNNADPDKWYESVNPILDTDPISLIADFIPTMKRMLDPNRERSGEDTATDFEEKMWKAYTDGDISRLPASKYRFDDDDDDAQYVGLPQEQAILIQSLLDKEYMNNMLDEAYNNVDEKSKLKIRDYKKVLDKLNKNIFENPGKWILVNEGVSPFREEVYGDNFEKVNETSGLGALKNFSVRWDPDAGMLDVKDDYDFSRKKIAEDIIPERDVPLRIRERIKYDPKKGSVLRNNDKVLPKRFVRKYEEGGEAKHWWSDTDKRDEIIKRQNDNGEWQEKRRRLLEQAHSDLEKGEINEDEFRRIAGFSNSEIGNLIISKDGNGEKIGAIINNLLDSIDIDKVKGGIGDAKEGKEDKNKEDAYPYKLMVESLLTLADVASSTPGMLRLYNKMGLDLMPILKTIAESSKIQTIAGLSNIGIDGSQIALDPEGDNAFNYAGILGGAAEAIGGTNVVRNMSFMGRYGNKVDDILDIANPVISTLGIVDDVSKMEEGGVIGKQREAYEYFTGKRGMSKIQALAIIGNLMAESGLKDDIYGDNRTSYGIQQWHNERMDKLFKHAKKKGHSTPTFKDQLEFLADEYEGKTGYSNFLYTRKRKEGPGYYNYSRQDFMNADNLKDAVVAWNQGAGRPHKSVIRNDDRYNYAMEVAKNLGLEIEENSVSSYGQMGFGDDGEIAASVTLPEVEVAAALPNPEAPSQERQSEEERFRTWTETYGKDIVAHLLSLKEDKDDDKELRYQQHMKENEEDKRRAFIQSVLPSIQLRIKGVTEV
jgi:GH24 family phage-related lysozyme (muramidase)